MSRSSPGQVKCVCGREVGSNNIRQHRRAGHGLSPAQLRMIASAVTGDTFRHVVGMSAAGGAVMTAFSLRQRGLLDEEDKATENARALHAAIAAESARSSNP